MVNRAISTSFLVEPTEYGWSVSAGTRRVGLFITQRQALTDVNRRRGELSARGKRSTLVVKGAGLPPPPGAHARGRRSFRFNR
jgi:hypothetical protein